MKVAAEIYGYVSSESEKSTKHQNFRKKQHKKPSGHKHSKKPKSQNFVEQIFGTVDSIHEGIKDTVAKKGRDILAGIVGFGLDNLN